MKAKITHYFALLSLMSALFSTSAQAAQLTEANIFYSGPNQAPLYSLANLSTSPDVVTNPTVKNFENWVLGKFNWTSATSTAFTFIEGNRETILKGIYWGDTTTSYDTMLHIYNNGGSGNTTTFTITDGITINCSKASGQEVKIRRKQNGGAFVVNVGDIYTLQTSRLSLGTTDSGQYLTSLNLTGNIDLKDSTAVFVTNNFQMAINKTISLNSSLIYFNGGVNESSGEIPFTWADVNLQTNKMSVKGLSVFNYGTDYLHPSTGSVQLGDISLASSDVRFNLNMYAEGTKSVGAINSTVAGDAASFINFKSNNQLITVKSMNTSVKTIEMSAAVRVSGDFVDTHADTKTYLLLTSSSASFTVDGTFSTTNALGISLGDKIGNANTANYSFGGIVGTSTGFITTGFVGGDRPTVGLTKITLTGKGVYETHSKFTDMGYEDTEATAGSIGTISIEKNGTGTQYIRGITWYRGDTVVNSGKLYIKADLTGRRDTAAEWGIGKVILNGGTFGAVGSTKDIGLLYAKNIGMRGGTLEFNFNDLDSDVIILLDKTSAVMSAAEAALFKFSFVIEDPVRLDTNYKIVEWDASIGALEYDTSLFSATITGQDDIKAIFSYASDGGLNVMFVAIPEPALLAALFGALALGLAIYRRRE